MIIEFFNDYYNLRTKNNFQPENIYNIDETMINLSPNRQKVVVFHDQPDPVIYENGKLEHITLLFAISAAGRFMKPLAILPLKTMPDLPKDI